MPFNTSKWIWYACFNFLILTHTFAYVHTHTDICAYILLWSETTMKKKTYTLRIERVIGSDATSMHLHAANLCMVDADDDCRVKVDH